MRWCRRGVTHPCPQAAGNKRGQDSYGSAMLDRNGRCWPSLDAGTIVGQLWGHYLMLPSQLANGHNDLLTHWTGSHFSLSAGAPLSRSTSTRLQHTDIL